MTEPKTDTKPDVSEEQAKHDVSEGTDSGVSEANAPIEPGPSEDPEVSLPQLAKVDINTANDAVQAFMQGFIDEGELRSLLGKFGFIPGQFFTPGERIDAAFRNKIPDDLYYPTANPFDDVERRQKAVDDKQKAREDAVKKAEKENKGK